jgi:hypothetical protein
MTERSETTLQSGMSKECILSTFIKKMTERSETTLQSASGGIFDILRFCGSLFNFVKFLTRKISLEMS